MMHTRVRHAAVALCPLLIALLPIVSTTAAAQGTPTPSQATSETVVGATNFQRLDANFASAGQTTAEAFGEIKKLGFRTVINLRMSSEPGADVEAETATVKAAGLQYFSLPFSVTQPDTTVVDRFIEIVKATENQPVYIHCLSGTRANAFWLIKRLVVDGWTIEKALGEADSLKMTNQRLREFALEYAKNHKERP